MRFSLIRDFCNCKGNVRDGPKWEEIVKSTDKNDNNNVKPANKLMQSD